MYISIHYSYASIRSWAELTEELTDGDAEPATCCHCFMF